MYRLLQLLEQILRAEIEADHVRNERVQQQRMRIVHEPRLEAAIRDRS